MGKGKVFVVGEAVLQCAKGLEEGNIAQNFRYNYQGHQISLRNWST